MKDTAAFACVVSLGQDSAFYKNEIVINAAIVMGLK